MIITILRWVAGIGLTICFGLVILVGVLYLINKVKKKSVKEGGGKTIKELDKEFHLQAVKDNKSWDASKKEEEKRILGLIDEMDCTEIYEGGRFINITIDKEELKKRIEGEWKKKK